ncbi:zinc finger, RING-type domain containing protein [Pseudohyphozyma bogoriensis]|nr:zinc finger, RING-type domain containing protein [Pseudohyphozyma bogoriensis]
MALPGPVDPGPSIQWARTPSHTHSLLAHLSTLPQHRQLNCFSNISELSRQEQRQRTTDLDALAASVFSMHGAQMEARCARSVANRLKSLLTQTSDHLHSLNSALPHSRVDVLQNILDTDSFFPTLYWLLKPHRTTPGLTQADLETQIPNATFVVTESTMPPKQDSGEPAECAICFSEFEPGDRALRLSCNCVHHEDCMEEWWAGDNGRGKFCIIEH